MRLAQDFVEQILTAHLSSSEEEMFGRFLESLAIFVASVVHQGHKSQRQGIDLEFIQDETYHIVQIKSGEKWGNSSQARRLAQDFAAAEQALKTQGYSHVRAVLGICYGKGKASRWRDTADKLIGPDFWALMSGRPEFYLEIIEPLGYQATQHAEVFAAHRARVSNRLVAELLTDFCTHGDIDWHKVTAFNDGRS